jgi:hypothetical protein
MPSEFPGLQILRAFEPLKREIENLSYEQSLRQPRFSIQESIEIAREVCSLFSGTSPLSGLAVVQSEVPQHYLIVFTVRDILRVDVVVSKVSIVKRPTAGSRVTSNCRCTFTTCVNGLIQAFDSLLSDTHVF